MNEEHIRTGYFYPEIAGKLSSQLLAWFAANKRNLPWRQNPTPYRVWISEIMLQQTQVSRVAAYFQNWMQAFPHVRAVADAAPDRVLKAWEGLGYYSRAKNIQSAAQILCTKHQACLPQDLPALRALPGIGAYTASAIASLAFNQSVPVVDANVQRVMARILDLNQPIKSASAQNTVRDAVQLLIPDGTSRELNQGTMELGALICLPRNPVCSSCPVSAFCRSLAEQTVHERPVLPPKGMPTSIQVAAGVLVNNQGILIQKRPPQGLMANLWEFPGGKLLPGETPEQALVREFKEELELDILVGEKITVIKHRYTSFRVTLHIYWSTLAFPGQQPVLHAATEYLWAKPKELSQYPFPSADRKLIQMLSAKDKD